MLLNFRNIITCIFFTLSLVLSSTALSEDKEISPEDLKQLRQNIAELKKQLEAAKQDRDETRKNLEKTEKSIGEISKKAKKLEKSLKKSQNNLDDLRDERSELKQKKKDQQSTVSDYIHAAYRVGQQSNLRLLLNQQDPSQVSRSLKYYEYFTNAHSEQIASYETTIARLDEIEPEIEHETKEIKYKYTKIEIQREELQKAQNRRKAALSKLSSKIANQDQQLHSLNIDRKQLEQLLSKVVYNIDDVKVPTRKYKFSKLKGKLPWPTEGKVLKKYGTNRVANRLKWQGMLIGAKEGLDVKAVHHGRVVFADYLRGHGLLIIVDHGSEYMTLYAHNQATFKETGEWVEAGEVIASVGNSGGQKKTALYFELRHKGVPQNPIKWFKRA